MTSKRTTTLRIAQAAREWRHMRQADQPVTCATTTPVCHPAEEPCTDYHDRDDRASRTMPIWEARPYEAPTSQRPDRSHLLGGGGFDRAHAHAAQTVAQRAAIAYRRAQAAEAHAADREARAALLIPSESAARVTTLRRDIAGMKALFTL